MRRRAASRTRRAPSKPLFRNASCKSGEVGVGGLMCGRGWHNCAAAGAVAPCRWRASRCTGNRRIRSVRNARGTVRVDVPLIAGDLRRSWSHSRSGAGRVVNNRRIAAKSNRPASGSSRENGARNARGLGGGCKGVRGEYVARRILGHRPFFAVAAGSRLRRWYCRAPDKFREPD